MKRIAMIALGAVLSLSAPAHAESPQDRAMNVYGIVFTATYNCPLLKINQHALAVLLLKSGVSQAEFESAAMTQKAQQAALQANAIFDTLDAEGKQMLCMRLLGSYGPTGTREPLLLELK